MSKKKREFNGEKIRAVLTQEPYYLNDYQEGEEYMMDKSQITDWIIYTEDDTITPDSIYVFEK